MNLHPRILAELSADQSHSVLIWSIVLIALLLVLFFAYSRLKGWMNKTDEPTPLGFSLSDLREMHRQGKMTDVEYELARNKMVYSSKQVTNAMPNLLRDRRTPPAPTAPPSDAD